jgi:hypothetical protein
MIFDTHKIYIIYFNHIYPLCYTKSCIHCYKGKNKEGKQWELKRHKRVSKVLCVWKHMLCKGERHGLFKQPQDPHLAMVPSNSWRVRKEEREAEGGRRPLPQCVSISQCPSSTMEKELLEQKWLGMEAKYLSKLRNIFFILPFTYFWKVEYHFVDVLCPWK